MYLDESWIDLSAEIEQACTLLRTRAESGRVLLSIDPEMTPALPALYADSRMIRQILLNLLSNAVKFTPSEGRVTIHAERDPAAGLTLMVTDTGAGMTEADIQVALAPFGQIRNPYHRREPGVGLGVPLTKTLIELHDGTLTLESTPGVGTTALVHFPPNRVDEGKSQSKGPS
ncbi:hypothetical protein CCP1ISM_5110002 [Azospirillaceae bacterium]